MIIYTVYVGALDDEGDWYEVETYRKYFVHKSMADKAKMNLITGLGTFGKLSDNLRVIMEPVVVIEIKE